jgi:glycosyltransferase involved in cell wall biosynthesis
MMKTAGVKGLLYKFFRNKEKALYKVSDYIGCMSPANVQFLLEHNPEIDASRVEVAPNSVELRDVRLEDGQEKAERYYIRRKYELPTDKPVFIYGGNLGKPQGIDYLVKCLEANKKRTDCYFVVVGTGTEYPRLEEWYHQNNNLNVKVMQGLPKADYDLLVKHCDVGMIFLDHRFTIPNYPSRLLSYLENKMPVLCATDVNTDIGKIAEENGYGYWCESVKPEDFTALVDKMLASDRKAKGEKGYEFLKNNYQVEHTYNAIMAHYKGK